MLGNGYFYNGHLRFYNIVFGDLFKDIQIERFANNSVSTIPVPIRYAAVSRQLARTKELYKEDTTALQFATTFPRITYEFVTMSYDANRKQNSQNILRSNYGNGSTVQTLSAGVPWNLDFLLTIYIKNVEDGAKIIEQILPYFTPAYSVDVNMPPLGIVTSVPIELNNVTLRDTWEGSDSDTRYIIWSLEFTMKAMFYPGITNSAIILNTTTNIFAGGGLQANIGISLLTSNTPFVVGEVVQQLNQSNEVTGQGFVAYSTANSVILNSITGAINSNYNIMGLNSGALGNVLSVNTLPMAGYIITGTPGQLANGAPTTNATASVAANTILPYSDYGFCTNVENID